MLSRITSLVVIFAIVCAIGIFVAGPLTRLGVWDYHQGLTNIRLLAMPVLAGGALSLVMFVVAILKARNLIPVTLTAVILSGLAAYIPLSMKSAVESNPLIHDITTDLIDPPQIVAGADKERQNPPDYVGGEPVPGADQVVTTAEAQQKAFPEIAPITVDASVEQVRETSKAVLESMSLEVIAEGPEGDVEGSGWRIEAVETSFWFGFKDDFVVRIRSQEDGKTRVDLRSKSRVGLSDLGANAARINIFADKLNGSLQ